MFINLSKKSYIFSPRNVTLTPTFIPSLSLKLAIDFLAFVTIGCCPVIVSNSLTALSIALGFSFEEPKPMLSTIFSNLGTCMMFSYLKRSTKKGTTSFVYFSFNLEVKFIPSLCYLIVSLLDFINLTFLPSSNL